MSDRPPSGLERLWRREELERVPRLGLSLDRIVQSGVGLADRDGLAAVSMKRVAESLGFTTMSLYRYVASKDDLLLLMHDTSWRPPEGLEDALGDGHSAPRDGWRPALARWTREQYLIMQRHPWLDDVRFVERAGTPSQVAWIDLGLRALTGTPLTEYQKTAILLLLGGYVSTQARLAATAVDAVKQGAFARPEDATEAFGALLSTIVDPKRFPALHAAMAGGAFAPLDSPTYAGFDLGLDLMLDGVEQLIERRAADPGPAVR